MLYAEALRKAEEMGYGALSKAEKDIIRRYQIRERNRRGFPTGGYSETIMRNRILRAASFGMPRGNTYR